MAKSPSHKFGQIIGNLLEELSLPILQEFCDERSLYLDKQGVRGNARKGRKVTWQDNYGNKHDLDFVIEKNGTQDKQGAPVAFIEAAWRRYTKHSKNKAQEIQGAVLPIAECYELDRPFKGAIIAGEFTAPSIAQLESVGFEVLYIPYLSIVSSFKTVGINAKFDEQTPDSVFSKCVEKIENLSANDWSKIKNQLMDENQKEIQEFFASLRTFLDRIITLLVVLPLYGKETQFNTVSDAMDYVRSYKEEADSKNLKKLELILRYSNGDSINASFHTTKALLDFLKQL